VESLKKHYEMSLSNKDSNIQQIESLKSRVTEEYERKIKQLQDSHDRELEALKNQRKREETSSNQKDTKDKELK
jgi:hypothetical protein